MIFRLAIGVLLGICWVQLQRVLPAPSDFIVPGLTVFGLLAMACLRRDVMPWVWPLLVAVLAALITSMVAQHQLDHRLPDGLDRASLWLEVVIEDLPTRHERGWRFEVSVRSARLHPDDVQTLKAFPNRGVMQWYDNGKQGLPAVLSPGQRWAMQAR